MKAGFGDQGLYVLWCWEVAVPSAERPGVGVTRDVRLKRGIGERLVTQVHRIKARKLEAVDVKIMRGSPFDSSLSKSL